MSRHDFIIIRFYYIIYLFDNFLKLRYDDEQMDLKSIFCISCSSIIKYNKEYEKKHWGIICPKCKHLINIDQIIKSYKDKKSITALEKRKPTFLQRIREWLGK